ncbi:MAG: hypothetical protein ACOYJI_01075 [Anaerovoracaceae bacterium]|jgi:uncharacterized protein (DUF4213/DUF364 family)
MTKDDFYDKLQNYFRKIAAENDLDKTEISVVSTAMTPEEAIGITKRKDYPILDGKEIMLKAEYRGATGQAFTSAPAVFKGSLDEIIEGDIKNDDHARSIFIASLNAVLRYLGKIDHTIHCRNDGPERCAKEYADYIKEKYGNPKILQIGFQPALFEELAGKFEMKLLDLNPANIGKTMYGVTIGDGIKDMDEAKEWADLIVCTGSTVCNGSVVNYLDIDKDVIFYGTSFACGNAIFGIDRPCFESE